MKRLRRALKPIALWINAWLYQASEDEFQHRSSLKTNVAAGMHGPDARYFSAFQLRLSAEQYRLRLRQRKLRAQRDRIHQW